MYNTASSIFLTFCKILMKMVANLHHHLSNQHCRRLLLNIRTRQQRRDCRLEGQRYSTTSIKSDCGVFAQDDSHLFDDGKANAAIGEKGVVLVWSFMAIDRTGATGRLDVEWK
mmetsp:Transcript_7949/g.19210  ORF Transcript_7949/g.19210 Transcript_7949/m.19210 type:complete len:113 (+) Transcript_7949:1661-1999(+)